MSELCDLGAVALRGLIGSKAVSPRELLESCIVRIERINPAVNAIVAKAYERARAEAETAEQAIMRGEPLGLLHGLPVAIKDTTETEGIRTTFGSPLYAENIPTQDEHVVARIRRAGAIVIGKTNTPEFAAGANTTNPVYGATGNPFDPTRICGGSSGGSAVALATGMVPIATGTDTGGSLRIPAAFCGVVGFRPSPGMVPSEKRPLGWTALSVHGPMARDVADAALLFQAQIGSDMRDPLAGPVNARDFAGLRPTDLSALRVVISEDLGFAPIDKRVRETFRARVALFRGLFRSAEQRPLGLENADEVFAVLRAANFLAAHGERYEKHRNKLGPNIIANVEQGLALSLADFARAHAEQTRIYRNFQQLFEEVDLVITPTVSVPPFPIEQRYVQAIDGVRLGSYFQWLAPTYGLTITGHPCVSIPCGLEPTGTPFALQLCAPARGDRFLLQAALALESALARSVETARVTPDLEALAKKAVTQ